MTTYRDEFPDFPEADMPAMPEGFTDSSWHNDVCPSIQNEKLGLRIFIDYVDVDQREVQENGGRFIVYRTDDNKMPNDDVLVTDNWDEVLACIARQSS